MCRIKEALPPGLIRDGNLISHCLTSNGQALWVGSVSRVIDNDACGFIGEITIFLQTHLQTWLLCLHCSQHINKKRRAVAPARAPPGILRESLYQQQMWACDSSIVARAEGGCGVEAHSVWPGFRGPKRGHWLSPQSSLPVEIQIACP